MATPKGAEELLNNFVETDTLVLPRKKPVEVTTQLIKAALGLSDEGIIETHKSYVVAKEIPKKRSMHKVKDALDPERRAQFQFYL